MKINVKKEEFLKALFSVNGVVTQRPTLPILSNVLIESKEQNTITLTSTDMEIGISVSIPASIEEEGSITVPARKLLDIVKELPSDSVRMDVSKTNSVSLTGGKTFIKLVGLSREDFPTFPEFSETAGFDIPLKVLQECIRMTSFAVSNDENKYVLNGMLFIVKEGVLKIVTTDGRRLAYIKKEIDGKRTEEMQVIIPTKTIHEIQKIQLEENEEEKIRVVNLKNQVVFKYKDGFILSRLIEGHFPDYEKVIPIKKRLTSYIKRNDFLSVVKRAYLLTSKEAQGIKLDFLKNKILISAKSPNVGELKEEIDVKNTGDEITIGFNPVFLIDVLKNIPDEEIELDICDIDKPGMIRRQGGDYYCVIMPMQIS